MSKLELPDYSNEDQLLRGLEARMQKLVTAANQYKASKDEEDAFDLDCAGDACGVWGNHLAKHIAINRAKERKILEVLVNDYNQRNGNK